MLKDIGEAEKFWKDLRVRMYVSISKQLVAT